MRSNAVALVALIASLVALIASGFAFFSAKAVTVDQSKDAEPRAQIQQFEKRVAELEQAIKELRASPGEAPRTETEKKLVGTWVVSDADKKTAWFTDMKLKGDGTCDLVGSDGKALSAERTYQVIGNHIVFTQKFPMGSFSWEGRLASVTDTELVIEARGESRKIHYTRAK